MDSEGKVHGFQLVHNVKRDSGYVYLLLKKMVELGMLKRGEDAAAPMQKRSRGRQVTHRKYYLITEKGRKYGEKYNARAIADNPTLIPFEEFDPS